MLSPKTLLVSCDDISNDIGQSPHLMGDRDDAIISPSSSECTTPVLSNDAETPELKFAFTEECEEVKESLPFDRPQYFVVEKENKEILCKTESVLSNNENQIRAADSVCITTNVPLTLTKEELDNSSSPISRAIKGINNDQQVTIDVI